MKTSTIWLTDPDITNIELEAVNKVLCSPRLSSGQVVKDFESAFAEYLGRKHAVAVGSGTLGMLMVLKTYGIGNGKDVIVSPYSWRETTHAVMLAGANPVFVDIDYWSGTLVPEKVKQRITEKSVAIVASNTNGHPAPWDPLRKLAEDHKLVLLEDSTEAIGSKYLDGLVGSFGDCAIFDFSQPGAITCGEGGMVVTDDHEIASELRHMRAHSLGERSSVVVSAKVPYATQMSDVSASLGLAQLRRLDEILAKRKRVEQWYYKQIKSFEGIKDPYCAPEANEVHWFLYLVHLGTRFTRSSRDAIVEDLRTEGIEAAAYCHPLHVQQCYVDLGNRRGTNLVAEKNADRIIALPFHTHMTEEMIAFIVSTMKDASINVGAGSAIYL